MNNTTGMNKDKTKKDMSKDGSPSAMKKDGMSSKPYRLPRLARPRRLLQAARPLSLEWLRIQNQESGGRLLDRFFEQSRSAKTHRAQMLPHCR